MSYIFSDLKTKLRTQIGDPNLDSTILADALNYTEQEIFNKFEVTLNSNYNTDVVVAGTNYLDGGMPSDLQRITALFVTTSGHEADLTDYYLANREFRKLYPVVNTTNPLRDWTYFTAIEFSTNADIDYDIRIEYIKKITQMSADADVPTIPSEFEELLMLGAKMRVYEQKEDFDYADQYNAKYSELLEAFISRYSGRQVDTQLIVPGSRFTSYSRIR